MLEQLKKKTQTKLVFPVSFPKPNKQNKNVNNNQNNDQLMIKNNNNKMFSKLEIGANIHEQ